MEGTPMKRLPVQRHLSAGQARERSLACPHPVEKARWHALWLLLREDEPRTPAEVAGLLGLSAVTARDFPYRWNSLGPDGLTDRRKGNGAKPLLGGRQRALLAAVRKRHPGGGLWTGPKVALYVQGRWGVAVCPQTGWQWPKDLGLTLQVPRPSHPTAAGPAERGRWKKT
jgi:transposase